MIEQSEFHQLFESVLETAVDGIINIDAKGMILNINQSVEILFGYSKSEMIGYNVSMLMNMQDAQLHDSYISNYLSSRKPKIIGIGREVVGKKKDGSLFPFRLAVSEVILNDRVIFTGIVHDLKEIKEAYHELQKLNEELDQKVVERTYEVEKVVNQLLEMNAQLKEEISNRKRTELALIQKEEQLQEALDAEIKLNELKSRFVTTASHEFRTPLTTILSSASLILKYPLTEQQNNRENHIQKIKYAVTHLTGILNDFLSLGKLEEGKISVSMTMCNVGEIVQEVKDSMMSILKSGQDIKVSMPHNSLIECDASILKNILFNLISNGVKYSASDVEVEVYSDQYSTRIGIIDHGIGIPLHDQAFLFERFYRATNVGSIQGTGLGLNIVKKYCDLIGATIEYNSEEKKGTTFIINLKNNNINHEKNSGH